MPRPALGAVAMTQYQRTKRHREARRAKLAALEADNAKLRELLRIALAALECATAAREAPCDM